MNHIGEVIKKFRLKVIVSLAIVSVIVALFFALDGWGILQRRMQSGVAVVTLYEDEQITDAEKYHLTGVSKPKAGGNGYSFGIDYGEVKGVLVTQSGEEIEFGFINTNNWHNVQIQIRIDHGPEHTRVAQTVVYKTDNDAVEVLQTEAVLDERGRTSVFREGV